MVTADIDATCGRLIDLQRGEGVVSEQMSPWRENSGETTRVLAMDVKSDVESIAEALRLLADEVVRRDALLLGLWMALDGGLGLIMQAVITTDAAP